MVLLHDMALKTCVKNSCMYAVNAKPQRINMAPFKIYTAAQPVEIFGSKLLLYGNSSFKVVNYFFKFEFINYSIKTNNIPRLTYKNQEHTAAVTVCAFSFGDEAVFGNRVLRDLSGCVVKPLKRQTTFCEE